MTRPLRVVLVGAGTRSGKLYLPWLASEPPYHDSPARAVAIVDRDIATAAAAAQRAGTVPAAPEDLGGILADTQPDLVIIATPDATHTAYATRALAAGCATLTEKPLATTIDEAFGLLWVAHASPAPLFVGHNLRFTNLHTHIHRLLAEGRIGTVTEAEFRYTLNGSHARSYHTRWHRRRVASGGLEITKASHHLDLLSWWLDARPRAVCATLERRHYHPGESGIPPDADIHDTIHAVIEYDSGASVRYALTSNEPDEKYTCLLRGTDGSLAVFYRARSGSHILALRPRARGPKIRRVIPREDGTHAGADQRMLAALPNALAGVDHAFATADEAALAVAAGATMHAASIAGRRLPVPHPIAPGDPR